MGKWAGYEVMRLERLTRWEGKMPDSEDDRAVLVRRDGAFIGIFLEAVKKLAQYEDTGLEPLEVGNGRDCE